MPLQPFEATKKLCERSQWTLSNLEVQKHLFLAQLAHMKTNESRLIDVTFEAWDYGPVVPEIYRGVRQFAARPVQNIFHSLYYSSKPEDQVLYDSYDKYRNKTPGQLVALTHKPQGAWDHNYKAGVLGIRIPDKDIYQEATIGYVRD